MRLLENWYEDYCRMILPRSPELELKYSNYGSDLSEIYTDKNIDNYIEAAENLTKLLRSKIKKSKSSKPNQNNIIIRKLLKILGKTATLTKKYNIPGRRNKSIDDLFNEFSRIINDTSSRFQDIFQGEIEYELSFECNQWSNIAKAIITNVNWPHEIWDSRTEELSEIDYSGNYEEQIKELRSDPNKFVTIDYWSYVFDFSHRDNILWIMNLAESKLDLSRYRQLVNSTDYYYAALELKEFDGYLSKEDQRYIALEPDKSAAWLSKNNQQYFPKSHFWWYYYIPKKIKIYE